MNILGMTHPISWNSAACTIIDGCLVAMAEEERFNKIKHSPNIPPVNAIKYCLAASGLMLEKIDFIAVGFNSAYQLVLEDLQSELSIDNNDQGSLSGQFSELLDKADPWIKRIKALEEKLPLIDEVSEKFVFVNHHLAHASSAFFPSGFTQANIISLDGSGGREAGILAFGHDRKIDILKKIPDENSWGNAYEVITEILGFQRHSGEGKTMGLAAYGLRDKRGLPFVIIDDDGIPLIDPIALEEFRDENQPRQKGEKITDYHRNLAATMQYEFERAILCMAEWISNQTGISSFCLAGGGALNCSANGILLSQDFVKDVFVQPVANDAGTALGAALFVDSQENSKKSNWVMDHVYWGPEYSDNEILHALEKFSDITFHKSIDICKETALLLASGKIVGWFQGRLEVGPRALGNRSILANPSDATMKDKVNILKGREMWRPLAPSILYDEVKAYLSPPRKSPFMTVSFDINKTNLDKIISSVHVDNTCRPQTVDKYQNNRFWNLINEFKLLTDIPVLLNTSFNLDGQPIVNTPNDAIQTYLRSRLDFLCIGSYVVSRKT